MNRQIQFKKENYPTEVKLGAQTCTKHLILKS